MTKQLYLEPKKKRCSEEFQNYFIKKKNKTPSAFLLSFLCATVNTIGLTTADYGNELNLVATLSYMYALSSPQLSFSFCSSLCKF